MNLKKLVDRAKAIIISPADEWVKIKAEKTDPKTILIHYVLPFVLLATVTSFIGYEISYSYGSVSSSIQRSIVQLISPLVGVSLTSYVIFYLAEQFQSKKDINKAFQLVGYSYTPSLLIVIIINLSPLYLSWLGLIGLYSAYLFWIGLPVILETPKDKKMPYVIVSILVLIVINILVGFLISKLVYAF